MKLRESIDTVISHNALVSLDMRDNDYPHYSKCVYSGMAHEISEELLEYELRKAQRRDGCGSNFVKITKDMCGQ